MTTKKSFNEITVLGAIRIFLDLVGVITIIYSLLVWMNWVPGFEFKRHRSDSVQPDVHLFPAQKVQLNANFIDGTQSDQIEWVNWYLKKFGVEKYTSDGLHPIILIPEAEGGIYQLEVKVKLSGEDRERWGSKNIYVVQLDPDKNKTSVETRIPTGPSGLSNQLIEAAKNEGIEVYQGSTGWRMLQNTSVDSEGLTIPANTELPSFDGKVILRKKGASKDLSSYETFLVPSNAVKRSEFNEK